MEAIGFFEVVLRAPSGSNFRGIDCELDTDGVNITVKLVDGILVRKIS